MRLPRRSFALAVLLTALSLTCAHHPARMADVRMLMAREEYGAALAEFDRTKESEGDVLYLLERGLLLHYASRYEESNAFFERAEILSEDLYTKSISREVAALLTSDTVLEYVPTPFEQVLINYFRALNYMFLDEKEGALVECRKASDKLALYSEEAKRPYRRDAFIEYLTGMLYEWDDEINDAFISYRNAAAAYETYRDLFGIEDPRQLTCDIMRSAAALGFTDEVEGIGDEDRERCRGLSHVDSLAKIIVFIEQGFVPTKQEWSLNIPILKAEAKKAHDDPHGFSLGVYSRAYGHSYDTGDIAYLLRIAIPRYPDQPPRPPAPSLFLDSATVRPSISEDVFAVAKAELDHDMPAIFAKTLARALIKYKATDKAEDKWGKLAGTLVNIATAATERADLRGWLSLPRAIYIAVLYVEPGPHTVGLGPPRSGLPGAGSHTIELITRMGTTNFVRFRTY